AGVLVRKAESLELMEKVDMLIVDKTGTLTEGKPRLIAVKATPGFGEDDVLRLAASLERGSEHPLAAAIVAGAAEGSITLAKAEDFRSVTGKGVVGRVDGRALALGNARLMQDVGVTIDTLTAEADGLRADGGTVMFLAVDSRAAGLVAVADPIKASTPEALKALKESGLHIVMVTGDNRRTAEAVGRKLGIGQVEAEVLPEDKKSIVERMQKQGR